jgi:hypothetical protein
MDGSNAWKLFLTATAAVTACRFVLGEGIEKRSTDLAQEVEAQTKAFEEAAAKKAAEASAAPAQAEAEVSAAPEVQSPTSASCIHRASCIYSSSAAPSCHLYDCRMVGHVFTLTCAETPPPGR